MSTNPSLNRDRRARAAVAGAGALPALLLTVAVLDSAVVLVAGQMLRALRIIH